MKLTSSTVTISFLLSHLNTLLCNGYVTLPATSPTRNTALFARAKGKASKNKKNPNEKSKAFGSRIPTASSTANTPSTSGGTWMPISGIKSMKDIDTTTDSKIQIVETSVSKLVDARTNPSGAVCITNYNKNLYCHSVSCASCQIPLTKAKLLPPNDDTNNNFPRIQCDFCAATYNLRTGEQVKSEENSGGGLFGGIVKGIYSAQKKEDTVLPTYDLGEKNGQVLIKIP